MRYMLSLTLAILACGARAGWAQAAISTGTAATAATVLAMAMEPRDTHRQAAEPAVKAQPDYTAEEFSAVVRDGFLLIELAPLSEGRRIEIRDDKGQQAFAGVVAGTRNEIDFRERAKGRYTIRMLKDGRSSPVAAFTLL
jgi:hypothetical protein